jgi:hypothetical protein
MEALSKAELIELLAAAHAFSVEFCSGSFPSRRGLPVMKISENTKGTPLHPFHIPVQKLIVFDYLWLFKA